MSMNTTSSGRGRIDNIRNHPQGEIRGATKLVKISASEALKVGMEQKAREFVKKGSEVYAKV
jgi:archaeosine-15-forming tRNA-guanine transglycosylase